MTGIGIDLLDVARLERALDRRPNLARRLFTERELADCRARARPAMHLAARFCAKEAVVKALGLGHCPWQEIEITSGPLGEPLVKVSERVSSGTARVVISLTHERQIAGAVAFAG